MSSTDSPTWWADVQQEREDLGGLRQADDWLGEDIDFVPRRRLSRRRRAAADLVAIDDADHELHGVFIPTAPHAPVRATVEAPAGRSRVIELGPATSSPGRVRRDERHDEDVAAPAATIYELAHLRAADDPYASPPPPIGARRTVQIKGRPGEVRLPSMALRHRRRTAVERLGPRPDRIAMWAVALGVLLIALAMLSN